MRTLILSIALVGCAGNGQNVGLDGNNIGPDSSVGTDGSIVTKQATIFTIVLENHDYAEIVGAPQATYINGLIHQYGLATNYRDTNHPSLPNYLHMISGADQFGGGSDPGPLTAPFPVDQPNLGSQMVTANIPWRAYAESMGSPCRMADAYPYAPRHNPFVYFIDIESHASLCASVDVDYGQFAADLATNHYRYMWITPNLLSDGHDPQNDPATGMVQTDAWLAANVPAILASDGWKNGGVLFITWDEAEGRTGHDPDQIPMIVISPKMKSAGMTSNTAFTHSSYTATVEDMLGMPRLSAVASSPTLLEFMNP